MSVEWRDIASFLLVFALLWGLGWSGQGFAYLMLKSWPPDRREESSKGTLAECIDVKWYWRLLLGYPPTNGKVAIRPAVLQILAIVLAVAGLMLIPLIDSQGLKSLISIFVAVYWILGILIVFAFLNKR